MEPEPFFEKNVEFRAIGYTFSFRARPSTIRRTFLKLLPWALYLALPKGRMSGVVHGVAQRFAPLVRQRSRY
jgi:hypothetical protein